jgi:hypothetical protein
VCKLCPLIKGAYNKAGIIAHANTMTHRRSLEINRLLSKDKKEHSNFVNAINDLPTAI